MRIAVRCSVDTPAGVRLPYRTHRRPDKNCYIELKAYVFIDIVAKWLKFPTAQRLFWVGRHSDLLG